MSIAKNIQSTTLELTPKQAREMALLCFADHRNALWSLADQVEAITKERDFLAMANNDLSEAMVRYQQLQEAAKLALDAMNHGYMGRNHASYCAAIEALRQAGVQ